MHNYQDLITIFDACFFAEYNTRLVRGDDEPIYLPADEGCSYNRICFAHGFYSSALHEISHWLVAGPERRNLVDFGYWYVPDGRNAEQQAVFQQVEVKPQAIECILSKAAGHKFHISVDNLNGAEADTELFTHSVYQQVEKYLQQGLPKRAHRLYKAISEFYGDVG